MFCHYIPIMPKNAIDYQNTIIYKIVCNNLAITDCYVGHTTDFNRRKSRHKHSCYYEEKKINRNIYKTIRDNGGWENWTMVEIEKFPCADRNEAAARERYWYEQLNTAKMNMIKPVADRIRIRSPRPVSKEDWIAGLANLNQSDDYSSDEWR